MTIELDSTIAQAEVLFLSFAQLMADMERRSAESTQSSEGIRRRRTQNGALNSRGELEYQIAYMTEPLRELLKTTR
jgi:TBC1 domain family member 15